MNFLFAKTAAVAAATSAVHLPQPTTAKQPAALASLVAKTKRPAAPIPAAKLTKRGRPRDEQARYHAKCRMVMAF